MRSIVLIAHNLRSTHNIGSLLRTAEGLGVEKVYITGYSPYPRMTDDSRLPHIANKLHDAIKKTALGAEEQVAWEHVEDIEEVLKRLRHDDYQLCALEQTDTAVDITTFNPTERCALLLGSEVTGIDHDLLAQIPSHLVIPMFGQKESFNVVQAAAMALYHLRFSSA